MNIPIGYKIFWLFSLSTLRWFYARVLKDIADLLKMPLAELSQVFWLNCLNLKLANFSQRDSKSEARIIKKLYQNINAHISDEIKDERDDQFIEFGMM